MRGERGDGFPPPKTKVGASPVWSWLKVAQWLLARSEVSSKTVEDAATILEFNAMLEGTLAKTSRKH